MKVIKYYICPICERSWTTSGEAIKCRNSHEIRTKEFAYCEACGAGWNVDHWGETAIINAKECEKKHREDGNYEEIQFAYKAFMKSLNRRYGK
ncbi:hypothetical protein ACJDU8_15610 [Clostridium sp. WILCCON 0269]|uniref:Uncharacterized protein n=1 Tax=Candidatus Clostridium eludens TaxID=3381663 RepID=A0ABW8SP82_9CLOT